MIKQKIRDVFENCPDHECIEVITSFKEKYYPTEEDKKKLKKQMLDVFWADGEFTKIEKYQLMAIEKLM